MNAGLSFLSAGTDEGHRDGQMEILVYNYPFASQAIFCGGLCIVRMVQPGNVLTDGTFCVQSEKDQQRCTQLKFYKPGVRSSRVSSLLFR